MLNLIRDNVQSFGVKLIVGVVVIVMAFFGISTYQSQSSNTVVTVDGYEVKIDKFQRIYETQRQQIRARYGDQADDYIKMINLEGQIIRQLASGALVLKSAAMNGLAVTDTELADEIYGNELFKTDERFDPSKYESNLAGMRIEKLAYEKELKEELLSRKMYRFIGLGALFSKSALEDEIRRYDSNLTVKAIEFSPSLFADDVKISEEEIKEYYELNKSDFQQKEQYAVNYFVLTADDVKDKVTVREKEIKRHYEKNLESEFTDPASFHSRHILISLKADAADEDVEKARTKAEEIHAQLVKNPKQFAKLAKKYSQDPGSAKKGGDLGWVSKGTFVPEFEEAVASLNKNELSEPFQSSHGFHIVELIDKKEAKAQPYESVKDQIKEQKIIDKAKRRVKNQAENLLAEAGEKTLEDLATASDKTIAKSGLFDDKAKLNDIGYSFQFYKKLQGAIVNQKGLYTPMGGQNYVLYEVVEIKEPFIKPFEEVKGNAEFYALDEKRQKVADEKLEAFATEIKTSKEFDNLARTLKTDAINASFKFSDQKIAELAVSTQFKADVYKMKKDSVKAITDGTKKFLVYLVDKKEGTIDEKNKHMLTYLEAQMRRQKTEILMTGLVNRLATQVSVDYNMPLLNAMNVRLDS